MVRRLESNLLCCDVSLCVQVCLLRRNSRISDEDIMEEDQEDVEESLTHKLTSRVDVT